MYIPSSFVENDLKKLHAFIAQHSFATLVSQNEADLQATHLPLLLEAEVGFQGRLIGHMARANSQWKVADGQNVLVTFNGPHANISPSWYEERNVVPTWNYVAVHVYGTLQLVENRAELLDVVWRSVKTYEAGMSEEWLLDSADPDFVDSLLDSIVAFTIDIERIEGKWKLSQNHDRERREGVIRELRGS